MKFLLRPLLPLFFLISVVMSGQLGAQSPLQSPLQSPGKLSGTITDRGTHQPISGATVRIAGTDRGTVTDK
ncbi:MAG TPA: hypothetical protein DIS79_05005, partial [Bacteroidetes bacterium]|nr:hypothetical protein [Bacteroidota bacterium]